MVGDGQHRGVDFLRGDGRLPLVVAHRGASAAKAEHTLAAYNLALQEGADGLECDIRLSRDGHLVCIHDRLVDRTSSGSGVVSAMTLNELNKFEYSSWHSHVGVVDQDEAGILTLEDLVKLVLDWHRPVKLFIETKHPVRYGSLVEKKLLELLHGFGIATPPSADHSRVVVMSFSALSVWRIRRSAPLLPTVLLGEATACLASSHETILGTKAIGPSIKLLRENPGLVNKAAMGGRATYCWTVDDAHDVAFCRELGVSWIATNYPGLTKSWLGNGIS
ncbi:MAG: glycerophosphodiester phosphodiesterase family protein [Mycobacteriaceae bacterium]